MIVSRLVEMRGEPPWRRFEFVAADEEAGSSMEIWAREVEWSEVERHPCPCCGYRTIDYPPPGTHEICPVCDWQDDDVQARDPWFAAGPNRGQSLYQRRAAFAKMISNDPARKRAFDAEWGPPAPIDPTG